MQARAELIDWLMDGDDPSLQYRVLTELLGQAETDPLVVGAKARIPESSAVQAMLTTMHPDGYWLQKNPQSGAWVGDGVDYGAFASTHFVLAYLSELGMGRSHPLVEKASERYLNLQQADGDWLRHFSCLIGYNIRTFARMGYRDDPRVLRALDLLLNTPRPDGGHLCEIHEGKYKNRAVKSCVRGSCKALLAFSEYPEVWDHPRVRHTVEYFLNRGGIFRSDDPSTVVNRDMPILSFPIIWRATVWEILYALSKMGHGQDQRLQGAWSAVNCRADAAGRFPMDWSPMQSPWKVGKRGAPSRWITFYMLSARKLAGMDAR